MILMATKLMNGSPFIHHQVVPYTLLLVSVLPLTFPYFCSDSSWKFSCKFPKSLRLVALRVVRQLNSIK